MLNDLTDFLAKNFNSKKSDKAMTWGSRLYKLPFDEGFLKEKMRPHNQNQVRDQNSCEIQGKNAISYTSLNFECHNVASIQVSVVYGLNKENLHESSFCDTIGIAMLNDD